MSADDEEEKESYGLTGRIILFLIIAGPGSLLAFGVWARIGLGGSAAAAGKSGMSLNLLFVLWFVGIVSSAIMIFKK